jgi:NAD(P)-dependent dehydrogenase (short-subunit alcohol dehydrogenase family)
MSDLKDKIALVTGASTGIGRSVALALANQGVHVIAVARTVSGLESLDDEIQQAGGQCTLVPLDLLEYEKIDQLGGVLAERFGKLDILIANAGMLGQLGPLAHWDPKTFEKVMAVNVTANYRLIRSLDPLLRSAEAGRAVFVTSGLARTPLAYWGAYAASKAALEQMVKVYASEVAHLNLKVNLLDPGEVRTKMHAAAAPGRDPMELPHPDEIAPAFLALCRSDCRHHGDVVKA